MHVFSLLTAVLGLLVAQTLAAAGEDHKVTVYAWPLSASSPSPLADITYSTTARVDSYTAPKTASSDEVVRVGLYDAKTKHWTGIATSASSFSPDHARKITLYLDHKNDVYHVGLGASKVGAGAASETLVELEEQGSGPQPFLNKPVVLSQDGKVEEKEPEKSFLQKYWWILALFLVLQVVGGGEK